MCELLFFLIERKRKIIEEYDIQSTKGRSPWEEAEEETKLHLACGAGIKLLLYKLYSEPALDMGTKPKNMTTMIGRGARKCAARRKAIFLGPDANVLLNLLALSCPTDRAVKGDCQLETKKSNFDKCGHDSDRA